MTKPREGFHTATVQFPLALWAALCSEAGRQGTSVNRLIASRLGKDFGIEVPAPKRPGPKPSEPPAEPEPKKGRKKA